MAKSKLAKRRRRRRSNPPAVEFAVSVGAGFAGYAATRFIARAAFSQAIKKWPKGAKHAHVAASAIGAAGVFFGSKYWSKLDDYHEAATIGAGIALIQTAVQTYLPQFGWIVGDVNADQYVQKKRALPPANLDSLMLDAPPAADSGFDLDALLAENKELEAVPVGQMDPEPELPGDPAGDMGAANRGDEAGLDDLENFNGMLN